MNGRPSRSLTEAIDERALDAPARNALQPLRWLNCGHLLVQTPGGKQWVFEGPQPGPQAHLTIHTWRFLRRILVGGDVGFAEAYMAGEVSTPDLVALLTFASQNADLVDRFALTGLPRPFLRLRHALNRNTRLGSRRNISAHYDLGNAFYRRWLDTGMTYSSALFSSTQNDLECAQRAKLDRVIELLDVRRGDQVLEIGFGWGSFIERLLETKEASITGLTLSNEQLDYARRRLEHSIASRRCELRLQDYRDASGTYDRVVSIEMLEAVGVAYWSTYFTQLRERLRPGGTAVLQVITIDPGRYHAYSQRPDFIQKHIFPGGMLPTTQILERETFKAGLVSVAQEFFGRDYARTLRHWNARFQAAWPEIGALGYDQRFKRMWEYYLAYCEVGFEIGALDVGLYKVVRP